MMNGSAPLELLMARLRHTSRASQQEKYFGQKSAIFKIFQHKNAIKNYFLKNVILSRTFPRTLFGAHFGAGAECGMKYATVPLKNGKQKVSNSFGKSIRKLSEKMAERGKSESLSENSRKV